MSKRTVELSYDMIDKIMVEELEWQLNYLKDEISKHAKGGWVHPDDLEQYIQDYAATKRVLERYTV
jgi:hypothetical protein